ncbi:hypothetical protein ACFY0F_21350 [Streptomyces sp. NPDC001544]|uniref:hypothetical protein n=1 Tax=Streptomyces sp. NPDC001544 TaxID=3364584 RepID=UPI0036A129AE
MITHSDDGPDFDPDDPLAVILRPSSGHLAPPPGRFEEIRRGAARRRLLRTAAGVGASCAVAAVLALPLLRTSHERPASPVVPLAPPSASSPSAEPTSPTAVPSSPSAVPTSPSSLSASPGRGRTTAPEGRPVPRPSGASPTSRRGAPEKAPSAAPSAEESPPQDAPTTEPSVRRRR